LGNSGGYRYDSGNSKSGSAGNQGGSHATYQKVALGNNGRRSAQEGPSYQLRRDPQNLQHIPIF